MQGSLVIDGAAPEEALTCLRGKLDGRYPPSLAYARDLVCAPLGLGRRRLGWGIKDPATLRYYRLAEPEFWILGALDDRTTLAELKRRFERQFNHASSASTSWKHFSEVLTTKDY